MVRAKVDGMIGAMGMEKLASCPGCGLAVPLVEAPAGVAGRGLAACEALYHQLAAGTLSDGDPTFPHQLAVDAYAAQHAEFRSKPMTTAFALIGLYLVCEQGATGRQVQRAHMRMARRRQKWPLFAPPGDHEWVTVADVLTVGADDRKAAMLRWARSVWKAWEPEHERVRALVRERLDPSPSIMKG